MSLLISNETSNHPPLDCVSPVGYMGRTCGTHKYASVLRCRKCEPDQLAYYYQKRAEIKSRASAYFKHNTHSVNLWTVGTNLTIEDLPTFRIMWKKFNSRLQKHLPHHMLLRVFEVGKNGYLHCHFVSPSWIKHSCTFWSTDEQIQARTPHTACRTQCAMCIWRLITEEYTGELHSNVNVSTSAQSLKRVNDKRLLENKKPLRRLNPISAIQYLAKYMMKASFGKSDVKIPRAHYVGKKLWYQYSISDVKIQTGLQGELNGKILMSNKHGGYKQIRYFTDNPHFQNKDVRTWTDNPIPCKECSKDLIIKAFGFEYRRDPFRVRRLINKSDQEELYLLEHPNSRTNAQN